jgi:hypothetical protein
MVRLPCAYPCKALVNTSDNFIPELLAATSTQRDEIYRTLLKVIVHKPVPDRPGRSEPRVRKRRPKSYPLMKQPRNQLHHQLQIA